MGNPFDSIVDISTDRPKEQPKEEPEKKVKITLTLDKRFLERSVYILIIIALIAVIYIDPVDKNCGENNLTGVVVADTVIEEPEITVNSVTNPEEEVTEAVEEIVEATEETNGTVVPFAGNFDLTILDMVYEKDADNNDRPTRMTSIQFRMDNRWKNFKPDVRVHWYDEDSSDVIENKIRAALSLAIFKKGQSVSLTIDKFDSTFFDPQSAEETIELRLYDRETDEYLTKTSKVIS
ncbi:hypothetical protein GOV09_01575 [Candidatus Woesearchaeota archaeon]|nr:hypothetical protein [Candidatus Woesearchaeota archaeon]